MRNLYLDIRKKLEERIRNDGANCSVLPTLQTLADAATGRIAIYYGCADTVTGLAFGYLDEIIEHIYTK